MSQPLMIIAATGVAAALTVAFADYAGDLVDASRARTAADAVALAGASGGRAAATRLASRNGGEIVSWSETADELTVSVRVGSAVAESRARVAP